MVQINEIIHRYKSGFCLRIQGLNLEDNSIIGLVGENGSGKTTLMSILSGYLTASESCNISSQEDEYSVLFIPADVELYEFLTVEELLRLVNKYSSVQIDEKEILEMLELTDKAQCQVDELSLGMRKKLTLLPLLINSYDMIILDEPFNSIDLGYIYKLKQILKEKKCRSTILISSHILETLVDLCDSFVLISSGSIEKVFGNSGDIHQIEGEIFDTSNKI